MLGSDLQPTTWSSTQIDAASCLFEEVVLLVELDELEGGTRAVALLLCKPVELVETTLGRLLDLFTHLGASGDTLTPGR